jgi:hypothetical protein
MTLAQVVLGQKTMAQSASVTIASDQTNIGVNATVVPVRTTAILHRNGVTAADTLGPFTAGEFTAANVVSVTGFLVHDTAYFMTGIPGNRWGPTTALAADTVTTTNDAVDTHCLACTIAQRQGAEWYDLFLSVDAVPLHVGRVTEAQRATGCEILTEGVVTAGGAAGVVNIGCVGTGVAAGAAPFAVNNAFYPANTGIVAVSCLGYSKAYIYAQLAVTDLRAVPSVTLVAFLGNPLVATTWHKVAGFVGVDGTALDLDLSAVGDVLCQYGIVEVNGASALKVLVNTIAGHDAAVSVWVQLV